MGGRRVAAIALGLGGVGVLALALAGRASNDPGQIIAGQSGPADTTTVLTEPDSEAASAQPTEVDLSSPLSGYGEIPPSYDMLIAGTQVILLAKPIQSETPGNSETPDSGEQPVDQASLELVTFEASELLWASEIATQYLDDDLVQGIDRDGELPLITVAMPAGYPASEIADAIASGETLLLTLSAISTPAGFVSTPVTTNGIFGRDDGDTWTPLTGALEPTTAANLIQLAIDLAQRQIDMAVIYERMAQPFEPATEKLPDGLLVVVDVGEQTWLIVDTTGLPDAVRSITICEHDRPLSVAAACDQLSYFPTAIPAGPAPTMRTDHMLLPVNCELCIVAAFDSSVSTLFSSRLPPSLVLEPAEAVSMPSKVDFTISPQPSGTPESSNGSANEAKILATVRLIAGLEPAESLMTIDCSSSIAGTAPSGLSQDELLTLAQEHCDTQTLRPVTASNDGTLIIQAPSEGRVAIVLSLTDTDRRIAVQP